MKGQYKLFNEKTVIEFTTGKFNELKSSIQSMSDDKILFGEFDAWVQYYVDRYTILPIVIYANDICRTLSETKIKARNICRTYSHLEPEFYEINGFEIEYRIPYSGDFHLLRLQPNTQILHNYQVSDFEESKDDTIGSFSICMRFAERDLLDKEDDIQAYVTKRFNDEFESYQTMIGYINLEIGTFNTRLKNVVIDLLNDRKNKAMNKNKICDLLQIPLKTNPEAPDPKPIPVKIIRKTCANPPKTVVPTPEYCISDQHYEYIMKVIHQCCTVMEETVKTSSKYEEEELRDQIIATLGTHFDNNVWGETFRREGKTDILIPFKDKAAFIAECKIWHGIKRFEDAVKQLFSYSTWKDTKVAVIVFNKTNRDFSSIKAVLDNWLKNNTVNYHKIKENCWRCVIKEEERNIEFLVTICVYDLSLSA